MYFNLLSELVPKHSHFRDSASSSMEVRNTVQRAIDRNGIPVTGSLDKVAFLRKH